MFNEDLECVYAESDRLNYMPDIWRNTISRYPQQQQQIITVITIVQGLNCRDNNDYENHLLHTYATFDLPEDHCIENMINGTVILAKCPESFATELPLDRENDTEWLTAVTTKTTTTNTTTIITTVTTTKTTNTSVSKENNNVTVPHNNSLGTVIFWGAQTYMNTNVAHVVLCAIVVVTYLSIPELGKSIYNRAVLRHNACLLALGCILTFLGYCDLCDCPMSNSLTIFMWILLQYVTNATVFWLNVICFDMTLSITRFRWMVGTGQRINREENRRLLLYGIFAWGGALIPAIVALILEYCPGIPEDLPLKPNYLRFRMGPNLVVNLYFFGIPLLTLFWNNVLFVFTTYKIIRIQRSTELVTKNNTNLLKKKYFLFLQLYLLMGAPWFFGALFACLNKLMILKMCRLTQPILWLLMLATHKKLRRKLTSKLCFTNRHETTAINS